MDGVKDREGVKLSEPDCVMDPVEDGDMVGDAVTVGVLDTLAELVQDGEGDEVVVGVRELDTDGVKDGLVVAERDVVGVGDTVAVTVAVTLAVTVALTDADRETEGDKDMDGVPDAVGVVDEDRDRVGLPVGELDAELQAVDPAGAVVPGGHAMGEPVPAGQYMLAAQRTEEGTQAGSRDMVEWWGAGGEGILRLNAAPLGRPEPASARTPTQVQQVCVHVYAESKGGGVVNMEAMGAVTGEGTHLTGHTPVQVAEARPAVLPYRPAGHDEQGDKLMPPRLYLPASHKYMESCGHGDSKRARLQTTQSQGGCARVWGVGSR
jgi:hypothetical protein